MKQYKYKIDGAQYDVAITEIQGAVAKVKVNGIEFDVQMLGTPLTEGDLPEYATTATAATAAAPATAPTADATPAAPAGGAGEGTPVKAPLPGIVLGIKVAVGQAVKKGDTLVVLEAMKMENAINAEADGTVTGICVAQGDSVMEGAVLVTVG